MTAAPTSATDTPAAAVARGRRHRDPVPEPDRLHELTDLPVRGPGPP